MNVHAFDQQQADNGFVAMNHAEPAFFPVTMQEMQTDDGFRVPGYRAVRRDDTMDILAVHSDGYNLTPYEDKVEIFRDAIQESNLDTTGMIEMLDMSHNGGRLFGGYTLPAHRVEIKEGDEVALKIAYWDSYDGSRALTIRAGAYRFACANYALSGKDVVNIKRKHTKNNDLGGIMEMVMGTLNSYMDDTENYRRWTGIPVNSLKAQATFDGIQGATEALKDNLLKRWVEATQYTGEGTLWDLYNVFTAWATHTEGKGGNPLNSQAQRMERVVKLQNSRVWNELQLAA